MSIFGLGSMIVYSYIVRTSKKLSFLIKIRHLLASWHHYIFYIFENSIFWLFTIFRF
jgi:hypothetical protein